MERYNTDLEQSLKWMQNEAPNIQQLVRLKKEWYASYHENFWASWERDVFNIDTANSFGLIVWCIILGVPTSLFQFDPPTEAWAFGPNRQNFISASTPAPANPNKMGGNFVNIGGALTSLEDFRKLLKLRYVTLVCNGNMTFINKMLNYIFNKGKPWDFSKKNYAYVIDSSAYSAPLDIRNITEDRGWQTENGIDLSWPGARTMYFPNNRTFSPSGYSGMVLGPTTTAPDGTSPATRFNANGDTKGHWVSCRQFTGAPWNGNNRVCSSIFAKAAGYKYLYAVMATDLGGGRTSSYGVMFDIEAGIMVDAYPAWSAPGVDGVFSGKIEKLANGWFRVSQVSNNLSRSFAVRFMISNTNDPRTGLGFAGDGTKGMYLWGAQVEKGNRGIPGILDIPNENLPTKFLTVEGADSRSRTDYTFDQTGKVTFDPAPGNGVKESWIGTWGLGATDSDGQQFATGDGTTTVFTANRPIGYPSDAPTQARYMEYRFGAALNLTDDMVATMNDRNNGFMPQLSGIPYKVIKES